MTEHDEALVEQAKVEWNAEADAYNQWEALDFNERIAVILPLARATDAARIKALEAALKLALDWLGPLEPPDSRAVSDEFVAMLAVLDRCDNAECHEIITRALT